jgi:HK97 family phage portal protein
MNRTVARRMSRIRNQRETTDDRYMPTARVVYRLKTSAGVIITADTSMTIAAVWACIRFLSQSIAGLPWQVRKPVEGSEASEHARKHPVQRILDRASPEWSGFQFRETLLSWALRRGNGYAEIERDIIGRPVALWPIHPDRVEVMRDETGRLFYKVDNGTDGPTLLDMMDMFHVRGFGEGPVGVNVMAYAAESLGWAKAAQLFGAGFFGNGAVPAGVVTMKRALTPAGLDELEKTFATKYGGPSNANKTAFLDAEMEYKAIGTDPDKSQFIETNKYLLDEVCRWFGVPPHKIFNLERATFSNIEHQSIEVVTDSLRPWGERFEAEADYKLFGIENRQGFYSSLNFTGLLRGDTTSRMKYYRDLREIGALSTNEVRAGEDMAPLSTKIGGEKYTMGSTYTTLEMIGEAPVTPTPAPGTPPGEPAPDEDEPDEPVDPVPDEEKPDPAVDDRHDRNQIFQAMLDLAEAGRIAEGASS